MDKLPEKLGGRNVGRYKGNLFRSLWELSFYKHLEGTGRRIDEIRHEPFPIPYEFRGRRRSYFPDFLVDGVLYEVKCERELARPRGKFVRRAKFEAAQRFCLENSLTFKVVTEKDFVIVSGRVADADPDVSWIRRRRRGKRRR